MLVVQDLIRSYTIKIPHSLGQRAITFDVYVVFFYGLKRVATFYLLMAIFAQSEIEKFKKRIFLKVIFG